MNLMKKMKNVFFRDVDGIVLNNFTKLHSNKYSAQEKGSAFSELKDMAYPEYQSLFKQTLVVNKGQFTKHFIIQDQSNSLNQLMNIKQEVSFQEVTDSYSMNSGFIVVYRIDSRSPDVIFPDGFTSRGNVIYPLKRHQFQPADDTAFISTTTLTPKEMTETSLMSFIQDSVIEAGLSSNELSDMTEEEMNLHQINKYTAFPHQMLIGEARSYIYKILLAPQQGIDMNSSLGNQSRRADQNEMVVIEEISPAQIIGFHEVVGTYPSDNNHVFISNEIKITISKNGF